jgi:hypothetical protein
VRSGKGPRYRGATTRCLPGSVLVLIARIN